MIIIAIVFKLNFQTLTDCPLEAVKIEDQRFIGWGH